jgi:hypothetical protein
MADEATLHDTLVSDPETTAPVAETALATEVVPNAPRIVDAPSPEAAEIGRVLMESGYSKDQLNQLLETPKALEALRYAIENDPRDLITMLQRNNPAAAERLIEAGADRFVEQYGDKSKATGKPTGDTSDLMREIEALREQTNRLQNEQQRRDLAAANAAVLNRYNSRVDDLLSLKEVKELIPTKSEAKNIKARLNVELGADPSIVQRINAGNFVDVPKVFQSIIDEVAAEKKEAVKAAADKREQAARGAFPTFENGPNPFLPPDLVEKAAGSWDDTETALAKALQGMR